MKTLRRSLLGLLLLALSLIGATAFLIGSPQGLGWLARQADQRLPGTLQIGAIEGGLLGRLRLQQVHYRDDDIDIAAEELILQWVPRELLSGYLHFADISLLTASYTQRRITELEPADDSEAEAPISLPGIGLPIKLRLDKAEVRDLRLSPNPQAGPIDIQHALLTADWNHEGIEIETLELRMPGLALSAQGALQPQGLYPLDLHTKLALSLPDIPKITTQGRLHGDLETLHIEQAVSEDAVATVTALLNNPLKDLHWQAAIDLQHFALQTAAADISGILSGALNAQGDLRQAHAQGRIALDEAADFYAPWRTELELDADLQTLRLAISRLLIQRPDSPLQLSLSGSADADLNLDLDGQWSDLQWPPSGDAIVSSKAGKLQLKGQADAYALQLTADIVGPDIPPGDWALRGHGDSQQFTIEALKGKALGGQLGAHGQVVWSPNVHWQATLAASDIDPATQYPEWPGRLSLDLVNQGAIENEQLTLQTSIDKLTGELRGRPLDASGKVRLVGEQISLDKLALSSGAARLSADGTLGDKSNLAWKIAVSDLADLLPDASGGIQGEGHIKGAMTLPGVDGELSAKDVRYQDISIAALQTKLQVDASDKTASRINLQASGIQLGEQAIPSLQLNAKGHLKAHRVDLQASHALADLALKLSGGYDQPGARWRGEIAQLDIKSEDFGPWALRQPSKLVAAADRLQLDELCLTREQGFLCAEAALKEAAGNAELHAKKLPLQWLQAFLPPEIERLDGELGIAAKATLGQQAMADARIEITPGRLVVHPETREPISIDHQGGEIVAKLDKRQLAGRFNLAIGEDGLNGQFNVPRAPLDKDPASAPLNGDVDLRFRQFDLFTGFVPLIRELQGDAQAKLAIGGALGQPQIKGKADVRISRLHLPDIGLDLNDIRVSADSQDGQHIRLDGGATSGQGELKLGGDIDLDAAQNWPMHITLKGQRFQLLNLPEMNAQVSTDLAFTHASDAITLEGTVEIPKAYIVLDDIPEGAIEPSSDVLIVQPGDAAEQAPPDTGAPFAMRLTLISGNDVQFRGFGLKAYFEGKLNVNQAPGEFPTGSGEMHIKEGTYKAYGQDLSIDNGIIAYSGGRIDNPGLSIRASRQATVDMAGTSTNVEVGVDVSGSAKKPQLSVYSDPTMEERDAISILLTGNIASNIGKGGGSLGVGKQLTKDLSVGAQLDSETSQASFVTKYRFNRKLHLEATTSSESNAADVFYSIQFD